jgi:hypothetical protein
MKKTPSWHDMKEELDAPLSTELVVLRNLGVKGDNFI